MLKSRKIKPAALFLSCFILAAAGATAQVGPPGGMIYAHDQVFRTVATPTQLPDQGPFETIYVLGDGLINVSETAPGDQDFNGGPWSGRVEGFCARGLFPVEPVGGSI